MSQQMSPSRRSARIASKQHSESDADQAAPAVSSRKKVSAPPKEVDDASSSEGRSLRTSLTQQPSSTPKRKKADSEASIIVGVEKSPARRSARLRGEGVEFDVQSLESVERTMRGRSRSITPTPTPRKGERAGAAITLEPIVEVTPPKVASASPSTTKSPIQPKGSANGKSPEAVESEHSSSSSDEEVEEEQREVEESGGSSDEDLEAIQAAHLSLDAAESSDDDEEEEQEQPQSSRASHKRKRYEEEVEEEEETVQNKRKRFKKSEVDDRFFNLNEMEEFLEREEKKEGQQRKLGVFDGADELTRLMRTYEEQNLQPRGWELAGEVKAHERQKDELLDEYVDVDFRSKTAPTITAEHTERLEAIIAQRVKDKAFDDVQRKHRLDESLVPTYRNEVAVEDTARKSLAEVYEEKFQQEQRKDQMELIAREEKDPKVEEIEKEMEGLFSKLDALSHYEFKPPEIRPEVKVVSNMSTLRVEEVGPVAAWSVADAQLLAPEEVLRVKRGPLKSKEERTDTDKKRDRRKKKKKQRAIAAIEAKKNATAEAIQKKKASIAAAEEDAAAASAGDHSRKKKKKKKSG